MAWFLKSIGLQEGKKIPFKRLSQIWRQGGGKREESLLVCPILSQQFQQLDYVPEMHSYFFSFHIQETDTWSNH